MKPGAPDETTSLNIGEKTANGAAMLAIAQVLARGLSSIRIIVLAAILPLHELGLFGIALVAMQFIEILSQTGLRQALIQRKESIDGYLGTAWTVQVLRGVILAVCIVCCSGLIEDFFEKDGIAYLLVVLALVPIIQGIQNVGTFHLHRELRFQKIVYLQISIAAVDLVCSVALAYVWPFAISLVIAKIIGVSVGLFLSFFLEKRRANISFSFPQFKELYKFGFWVFVSAVLSFIMIRGGDLVIGKLLTESDLAIYQIAYGMACIPIMQIMAVVSTTTFSAYSRIQDSPERLRSAFKKVLWLSSCVAGFSIAGFATISQDFVDIFFRKELQFVAQLLPLLAVWGACRALGSTNSVLFQAIGKPALASIFQFLMVGMFIFLLIPMAINYDTIGVVISLAIIGVTAQLLRYTVVVRTLEIDWKAIAFRVILPIIASLLAYLTSTFVLSFIAENRNFARIAVALFVISLTYGVCIYTVDAKLNFGLANFIRERIPSIMKLTQGRIATSK